MGNSVIKPSMRQQQRSLTERMSTMEEQVARILFGVNQRFSGNDSRLRSVEELVEALIELNGDQDVRRIVREKQIERAQQAADAERKSLEEGVKDGYIIKSDVTSKRSLIVGRYISATGEVEEPGRTQLVMPGVDPKFQELLLGKGVGATLDLPNGSKFELTEIYEVDDAKFKALQKERTKKQAEAAAAVAAVEAKKDEVADTGQAAIEPATESEPAQTSAGE